MLKGITFSHGTSASVGVCVAVKRSSGVNVVRLGEISGRLLALDLSRESDGLAFCVICIYAPSSVIERSRFFKDWSPFVKADMILVGDFNSVTNTNDRLSGKLDRTSAQLQQCLTNFSEPPGSYLCSFSYHHPSLSDRKSHLDHFHINFDHSWVGYTLPFPFSNHYLVGLYVPKLEDIGLSQWRFPKDLLNHETFKQQIDLVLDIFWINLL